MNGDDTFAKRPRDGAKTSKKRSKAFDDIATYFSKKEWKKMKYSERISYVYMKRNYKAMTKLGFKVTLPPFMCNKQATDFQGNDFDNDHNRRIQVEHPQMTFGRLHRIIPKGLLVLPLRHPLWQQEGPAGLSCYRGHSHGLGIALTVGPSLSFLRALSAPGASEKPQSQPRGSLRGP
ncbi:protein SSX1 isoform X2 [Pan troglodytes]|uniref:protein SSX1 isoform X2 n=1 Tax=Pan troglodytes TaxID=9598 RepID=UPI0007DBB75B|nr:protein SSX1 isoform X2 [Pan troglodytes]